MSGVTHEAPIDPNIIICRSVRREALLETAAHLVAIQRRHLLQRGASLIDIFDDHAGDPLVDHLRNRARAIGEDRRCTRCCLDTDETKRLGPADRKQQRTPVPGGTSRQKKVQQKGCVYQHFFCIAIDRLCDERLPRSRSIPAGYATLTAVVARRVRRLRRSRRQYDLSCPRKHTAAARFPPRLASKSPLPGRLPGSAYRTWCRAECSP
jgi:hypothetical protein